MTTIPSNAPAPHPLFGELIVVPPDQEAEAVVARTRQWNSSLKPWDLTECWLVQDVARETFRLERIHQREIALRAAQATQAQSHWDEDRRSAVKSVAAGLSRNPAHTLALLRHTKHGCELIAGRWDTLAAALETRGSWTATERLLALNLLDVPPELREAPSALDAPAGVDPLDHLREVAADEAARHRRFARNLEPVDAIERESAALGLGADTPELASLRKEERLSTRQLAWCRSQFKSSRLKGRIEPGDAPPAPTRRFDEERPAYKPPRHVEPASPADSESPAVAFSSPTDRSPQPQPSDAVAAPANPHPRPRAARRKRRA